MMQVREEYIPPEVHVLECEYSLMLLNNYSSALSGIVEGFLGMDTSVGDFSGGDTSVGDFGGGDTSVGDFEDGGRVN